jgi:hypothetical protein
MTQRKETLMLTAWLLISAAGMAVWAWLAWRAWRRVGR